MCIIWKYCSVFYGSVYITDNNMAKHSQGNFVRIYLYISPRKGKKICSYSKGGQGHVHPF